jgi:hypothetical protein
VKIWNESRGEDAVKIALAKKLLLLEALGARQPLWLAGCILKAKAYQKV